MEVAFRQSLMISHGGFAIFLARPVSLVFLLGTLMFLLMPLIKGALRSFSRRATAKA
jgi:TctA family transporter